MFETPVGAGHALPLCDISIPIFINDRNCNMTIRRGKTTGHTHSGASVSRARGGLKIDDCCGPGHACARIGGRSDQVKI